MVSYITPDELEAELPFNHQDFELLTSGEFDTLLSTVIERESARVEEYAGVAFEERSTTDDLDGEGLEDLSLPGRPVQSVQSVTATDPRDGETDDVTADVAVYDSHITLTHDADIDVFPVGNRNVSVEYAYGYNPMPPTAEEALVRLCRKAIGMIEEDGINMEAFGGGASVDYQLPSGLRASVYQELQAHAVQSPLEGGVTVI